MLDANVATDVVGVQKLEGNLSVDLRGRHVQQRRAVAVAIQLHPAQIERQVILAQIGCGSSVGQVVSKQGYQSSGRENGGVLAALERGAAGRDGEGGSAR